MVIDQTFEGGAWLGGRKSQTQEPSTFVGGPQHQDHAKMNAWILGNAMVVQRQKDQNVVSHICAKRQHEWDNLVPLAK
jgi:hypothetical protein